MSKSRLTPTSLEPVRRPTRAFYREGRALPGYSLLDWLHGYVYARWPYLYIGLGVGEHRWTRLLSPVVSLFSRVFWPTPRKEEKDAGAGAAFADSYHGKVMPLESARRLISVDQDIDLRNLEQVIPYTQARDIVLQDPDHIVALDCPCRSSRREPCLPLDVCLIVGEPFASFASKHHEGRSRWVTQQEAIEILDAEHERGHVHHAFFKDAMLGRYYAICNCCSCCCGAMQAWQNETPMLASSGFVSQRNASLCEGCGDCAAICPFGAICLERGLAVVDQETCMGCGVCVTKCKAGALSLVREPGKGTPLEISALLSAASDGAQAGAGPA